MMRRKLLHKEVCGATKSMMDKLIVGEHQVDGTRLLIYIYIYLYIDFFFAILASQVRCYCILYLLCFIVTCIGQNFCIQTVMFLYIILTVTFFLFFLLSIIGCHNCSYSAILNNFLYLHNSAL